MFCNRAGYEQYDIFDVTVAILVLVDSVLQSEATVEVIAEIVEVVAILVLVDSVLQFIPTTDKTNM